MIVSDQTSATEKSAISSIYAAVAQT